MDGDVMIHTEWFFRDDGNSQLLMSRSPEDWISFWTIWTVPPSDNLNLYSVKLMSINMSEDWAKTTVAEYEERVDGVLTAGGIGTSAGQMGIGGYDLRTLAIKDLAVVEKVTNLADEENNTLKVTGDICSLPAPGVSTLYTAGWIPSGDVSYTVSARDLPLTDIYWTMSGTESPSAPDSNGKLCAFEEIWNGKGTDEMPVTGFHQMEAKAQGPNAAGHSGTSFSRSEWEEFVTYDCACSAGANSVCSQGACYVSFDYGKTANSFGYGWSSEATAKIEESGDDIFYKGTGSYARWTNVAGSYVPFNPANYTQLEKDLGSTTARYKLTSKDQNIQEFDSDGKLRRALDRNGNEIVYSYNSSTGYLESVSDGNGRSRHYTTRADGQPLTLRENDATTGRLTQYEYYPDTDPDIPDRLHKVIDPEGNETEYLYYVDGPLMAIIDPEGLVASFYEYDEYGRLVAEEIYGERRLLHEYLSDQTMNRNQVRVQNRNIPYTESRWHYEYRDRYGNTTRTEELTTIPPDSTWVFRTTLMEYEDPNNPYLLTKEIDHNLNFSERTYTPNGNIKTVKDKAGAITTYVYAEEIDEPLNPKHRNLIREIHRPSVQVEGKLVAYRPTVFEYDAHGNLERVIDAKGQTTAMTYASDGKLLSVTNRRGHTTEFVYEGSPFTGASRNLLQIKTPKGDSALDGFRSVYFEYDEYDNVVSTKDDLDNEVVSDYDLLGRVIKVTDPMGAETEYAFENTLLEEVILPPNNGSSSLARKVTMLYDDANRLEEIRRDIDSSGTQEMRVKYGYTYMGELASLTRLKNGVEKSFTYNYDNYGRMVEASDSLPVPGTTTTGYEIYCKGHSVTSPKGVRHKMSLDARCLLRELQVGDVDESDPLNLELVSPRETRSWDYDELGRMVKSKQMLSLYGISRFGEDFHAFEEGIEYDELDRVIRISQHRPSKYNRARFGSAYGNGPNKFAYAYDPEGNLVKATDPDGKVTEYSYFRDNLLKQVIIKRPSASDRVFTYSYDDAGRLLQIVYPLNTEVVAKFDDGTNTPGSGWDAKGQLLHLRYEKDGTLIRRFAFTYDQSGNRASQLDVTPTKAIKWEYVYDWLDRLEVVKRAEAVNVASLPGTIPTVSVYTYDASDNRIEFRVEQEDLTYRYVVDDADNLTEIHLTDGSDPEILIETLSVDDDGNTLTRTNELTDEVTTYQWDDFNKLVKVSSAISGVPTSTVKESNRYDLKGIRRWKKDKNDNTSNEFTAGISTVASKAATSGSSAPTISYLMGHQLLGAEVNGNFQFFLPDALGTVRDVVDDTGAVIQSYEFNEHGIPMDGSGAGTGTFSPKTYQGGLSVNDDRNDSGLYLMGFRHFDPELGRFISRDPIGFKGGLNLFGTGFGNNPVTYADPSGLATSDYFRGDIPVTNQRLTNWNDYLTSLVLKGSFMRDDQMAADASLISCFKNSGFTVHFGKSKIPGLHAVTNMKDKTIFINQDLSEESKISAYYHELLHAVSRSGCYPKGLQGLSFSQQHAWTYIMESRVYAAIKATLRGNPNALAQFEKVNSQLDIVYNLDVAHNADHSRDFDPAYLQMQADDISNFAHFSTY